jgi:uncharacterized DUF497 family protein
MDSALIDWDEENIGHLLPHQIVPDEVEQVIQNRPLDIGAELRNGEERISQIGETDAGRILIVITTMAGNKIRVVTAWPAKERFRRYFETQKRNGNVGRTQADELRQ